MNPQICGRCVCTPRYVCTPRCAYTLRCVCIPRYGCTPRCACNHWYRCTPRCVCVPPRCMCTPRCACIPRYRCTPRCVCTPGTSVPARYLEVLKVMVNFGVERGREGGTSASYTPTNTSTPTMAINGHEAVMQSPVVSYICTSSLLNENVPMSFTVTHTRTCTHTHTHVHARTHRHT